MKTLIFIVFSFISVASALAQQTDIPKDTLQKDSIQADSILSSNLRTVRGKATYYASKFHGRRTSNGDVYSNNLSSI